MNLIPLSALLVLVLVACSPGMSLPGDYKLVKVEQSYFLTGPGSANQDGGGAIEGTVIELEWNDDVIAAKRYSTFRGDLDGWMIIETKTKVLSGPLSEKQFSVFRANHQMKVFPLKLNDPRF